LHADLGRELSDPDYHRLKKRARDAVNLVCTFFLIGILIIIIYVIVGVLW
jgi:succinate dehydrogenase hydrophobic anchor subunit